MNEYTLVVKISRRKAREGRLEQWTFVFADFLRYPEMGSGGGKGGRGGVKGRKGRGGV